METLARTEGATAAVPLGEVPAAVIQAALEAALKRLTALAAGG